MQNNKNEYIEFGKQVINKISEKGGKAYFFGECVRNIVLKKPISKVNIYCNLSLRQLMDIFSEYFVREEDDETIKLVYMEYIYYITSYRAVDRNDFKKAMERHVHADLLYFLQTRDFINDTIALQYSNRLIDPFQAIKLNKKKRIKMFENPKKKFAESPIRMIKAVYLVSQTGFKLEKNIIKGISRKKKLVSKLSPALVAMELRGIFDNEYAKHAVAVMINTGLYKKIPVFSDEFKRLAKRYRRETNDEFVINSLIRHGFIDENIIRAAVNEEFVRDVVTLALKDSKCNYDDLTLYKNGLDVCLAANKANYLLKKSKKKYKIITKNYEALPIKKTSDLALKPQDVLNVTKEDGNQYLEQIMSAVQIAVVTGEIINDYDEIRDFIIKKLYELKNPVSNVVIKTDEDKNIEYTNATEEVYSVDQNTTPIQNNVYYPEEKIIAQFNDFNVATNDAVPTNVTDIAVANNYAEVDNYYDGYPASKAVKEALFQERLKQINLDALEDKLNKHIDALIKKSNALGELKGNDALDMYHHLKDKYKKILMDRYPEYNKLKERYSDRNGISNDKEL